MKKQCNYTNLITKHGNLLFFVAILGMQGVTTQCINYSIDPKPLCTLYTPNSILEHKEDYRPLYAGDRIRYSTCTGVAWFHDHYLAVLNLFGKKLETYHFDQETFTCTPLQTIDQPVAALVHAENLSFSPDGTLLALCSDNPHPGVKIYRVDTATHQINPQPIFSIKAQNLVHNVRFTHDGNYVAMTGWDNNAALCIYKITKSDPLALTLAFKKINSFGQARAKAINFTQDDRFAIISYSIRVAAGSHAMGRYIIHVHEFDSTTGSLGKLVCALDDDTCRGNIEDIAFLPDDTAIALSDQGRDLVVIHPFDRITGIVDPHYTLMQNPEAQLSFPHGMSISSDNKFFAVTNYGDDKVTIYKIKDR